MFGRYRAYLRDNPNRYWFKRKLFGWGWVPVRWPGWVVVAAFIGYAMWCAGSLGVNGEDPSSRELLAYIVKLALGAGVVIGIGFLTGEPPAWQWGLPKDKGKRRDR